MKNQNNSLIKYKYRVEEGKQYSAIDLKSTIDIFYVGKIYNFVWCFLVALLTIKIVSLIGEPFYYFLTNNADWMGNKVIPIAILVCSATLSGVIVSVTYILVYFIILFLLDPIVTRLSTKEDYSQQKLDL